MHTLLSKYILTGVLYENYILCAFFVPGAWSERIMERPCLSIRVFHIRNFIKFCVERSALKLIKV
jgi:hypothetical protein